MIKKILIVVLVLLVIGCSGGGSSSKNPVDPGTAPGISNLTYSPKSANIGEGGGAISANIEVDFIDIDGDITVARLTSSNGGDLTIPITGIEGVTVGSIIISMTATTTEAINITFQVWLIDSNGNESNKLSGAFTVS